MHAASSFSSFRPCTAQMRAIKWETKVEETAALCLHMQEMTSPERERGKEGRRDRNFNDVRAVSKRLTGRKPRVRLVRNDSAGAAGGRAVRQPFSPPSRCRAVLASSW